MSFDAISILNLEMACLADRIGALALLAADPDPGSIGVLQAQALDLVCRVESLQSKISGLRREALAANVHGILAAPGVHPMRSHGEFGVILDSRVVKFLRVDAGADISLDVIRRIEQPVAPRKSTEQ